jgi:hypothetical protein
MSYIHLCIHIYMHIYKQVIKNEDGQVMVPGIDLSDHNSDPTCIIADDIEGNMFILKALKDIPEVGLYIYILINVVVNNVFS